METIVLAVVLTLASVMAIGWSYLCWRAWREQIASREKLRQTVFRLDETCEKLAILHKEHGDDLGKMFTGLINMTKEQVGMLQKLSVSVDIFRKTVAKPEAVGGDSFQEYDEHAADQEFEVQEYMRSGVTREEALDRVREANVYRRMRITG